MSKWTKFDKDDKYTWPSYQEGHLCLSLFIIKKYGGDISITSGQLQQVALNAYKDIYRVFANDRAYEIDNILYWSPIPELPDGF